MHSQTVALLVVAAGRGARLGAERPKQYLALRRQTAHRPYARGAGGRLAVLGRHCRDPRRRSRALRRGARASFAGRPGGIGPPAIGGATRQQSVLAGLEGLASAKPDLVLIHDAARPFPSRELIGRAVEAAERPWRGGAGNAAQRHGQTGRRRRPRAGDPAARGLARRADAAGVSLPPHSGGPPARGGRAASAISPTTSRSPNGQARRPSCSRAIR